MKKRILIAYYSRKGQNYSDGSIVDLKVGNTEKMAGYIKDITGGDLFEITTVKSYPLDYTETTRVAQRELDDNTRPELKEYLTDLDEYDTLILGYPNWWGTMPMAVFSCFELVDLSGKTILPFCTHEGSGLGHSIQDLKSFAGNAEIKEGLAVQGSQVDQAQQTVSRWLKNLEY